MKHALSLFYLPLALITLIFLNSCSQENAKSNHQDGLGKSEANLQSAPEQKNTSSNYLLELPAPNAAAMDAAVASVLESSWKKFNDTMAQENLTPQAKAQAYATYGLAAFGNGLALPAETAFENATHLDPQEARWVYFLALIHQYNGKLDKAVTSFDHVLNIRPENIPALLRLGNVRFEQADMPAAESLYRRVLNLDADSAAAHYGLGRVASAEGKHKEALGHFEKAIALQPGADRINYFLGMTWRDLGEIEKAKMYLAKHGSIEPGFSDPLFDEISGGESRIDGLWAHMNAGSQAFVEGRYSLAVEQFQLATSDLPDDPRSWQSLGMALNKKGDSDKAISAYSKALSLSENNAVIHHELAKLMMATGDVEKAEAHLVQAIAIDPRMLAAHTTLARLMTDDGRTKEALKHYTDALALDPQSGELAISRAQTLVALGQTNDAVSALADTIKINPRDADVRMAYGLVLVDAKQLDAAMTEVSRALKYAEDDATRARAHFAIGQVHLRQGDADSAIGSFSSALQLNPEHRSAALGLARTFIRTKNYSRALGTYEVFLDKWPDADPARVEAARVAVMLGNGSKARSILEVASKEGSASARLLGSLARLLVLSTEPDVKDPELALKYAQAALQINSAPQHRETVALSYAGAGRFEEAVKLQERLVKEAGPDSSPRVRSRMGKNLERYRTGNLGRLPFDAS